MTYFTGGPLHTHVGDRFEGHMTCHTRVLTVARPPAHGVEVGVAVVEEELVL